MSSAVVLSYHDAVIRQSDIDILKTNSWLTDSIIGFYLQYLEKEVYMNNDFLFVSPEVTQCIKSSNNSEIPVFLDPLNPRQYLVIFFPLNNNENVYSSGGSHWSLLVYFRLENIFYHFDSSNDMNDLQATALATKLQRYFDKNSHLNLKEGNCLQQSNDYDCGIYLLCNVDNVAKVVVTHRKFNNIPRISKDDVKFKRASILSLIYRLQKKSINS
ncbi:hypothetical protein PGB90_002344 [Kerria lacca]